MNFIIRGGFPINVLSLFDGISCGRVALERSGFNVENYYASEINQDSIDVANDNYKDIRHIGDVTKLDIDFLKTLPKIDLLIGGSPCQGLSKAKNNRENLLDPRSKLFFEYVRIKNWLTKNNNPELKFVLENVKPNKETIEIINKEMGVEPIEINSVLVSPQRRIRLYWTNIPVDELPENKELTIKDIIYDNTYKVFQDDRIEKSKAFTKNYVKWDMGGKGYWSQQDRAYYLDGTMCTVPKSHPVDKLNIYLGEDRYRRCHPIEAERLQTLPDNYTSIIKSPNKRMGLVGDGWTVDVIVHILKGLK